MADQKARVTKKLIGHFATLSPSVYWPKICKMNTM
jgi:hypothetical protein